MVTKEMIVTDILAVDPDIGAILMSMGLHCIGCMAASGESLSDAMLVHGYGPEDADMVVSCINTYLKNKAEGALPTQE